MTLPDFRNEAGLWRQSPELARQNGKVHVALADLQTFTIGLPYDQYDEAPTARLVAETFGTTHREETITPSLLTELPRLVATLDEPSDSLAICMDKIAALASRHVKVVFGGDGAHFAVPPEQGEAAAEALSRVATWAGRDLDLELRVGMTTVAYCSVSPNGRHLLAADVHARGDRAAAAKASMRSS